VDLPGIQTFPEQLKKQTTQLVSSYLQEPDTLVLCVVDATTPALDSTVALEMVRDAGKLSHTILALTKSDLVNTRQQIPKQIFDRVLGTSNDMLHLPGLAGCVAVTNRYHKDGQSLNEADRKEAVMFGKMLHEPGPAYTATEVQDKLREHLGVSQLINKLDDLFGNFIVQRWTPVALEVLRDLTDQAKHSLKVLGPPVEDLTKEQVLQAVIGQVRTYITAMPYAMSL